MKAARDLGLRPTNHTDAFVVPVDQMMTVWTAVNRPLRSGGTLGADQRITPYQALQAITIDAAFQYREEASKGSIELGKRADLVILSADPTKVDPKPSRTSRSSRPSRTKNGPEGAVCFECAGSGGTLPIQAIPIGTINNSLSFNH